MATCRSLVFATTKMMSYSGSISGVEEKNQVSKTLLNAGWVSSFFMSVSMSEEEEEEEKKKKKKKYKKDMTAIDVHQFAECITCHAWSPDRTMVAFCPNSTEVHIYRYSQDQWERVHVLQKHDQIVSGIDWSSRSNKIVTVSHDRNSYVWNQEGSEWVPTLVILRLNRAALCVQWSPKENKFAVGSGAKTVCICYYEQENNWWVSKLIRKRHNSSVTSVAWHPNNILLATTSTDGKCRIFSTFIKGVDSRDPGTSLPSDAKFGEQIVQLDLCFSWAFGVKWSPSGNILAYVGHNSMIYFIEDVGPSPSAQSVAFRDLPLRDVLFVSEKVVIGVGFDYNPMVFTADESGLWSFHKFLDERKTAASSSKYGSQFSEAFGKLYGQSKHGTDAAEHSRSRGGVHQNCINCIVPLKKAEDGTVKHFSTSGAKASLPQLEVLEVLFSGNRFFGSRDFQSSRVNSKLKGNHCKQTVNDRCNDSLSQGLDGRVAIWDLANISL